MAAGIITVTDPQTGRDFDVDWADTSIEPTKADIDAMIDGYHGISQEKSNSFTDKALKMLLGNSNKPIMDYASEKMKQGKDMLQQALPSSAMSLGVGPFSQQAEDGIPNMAKPAVGMLPETPRGLAMEVAMSSPAGVKAIEVGLTKLGSVGKALSNAWSANKNPKAQFDTVVDAVGKYKSDMYDWFEKAFVNSLKKGAEDKLPVNVLEDIKTSLTNYANYGDDVNLLAYQKAIQNEIRKVPKLRDFMDNKIADLNATDIKDIYTGIRTKIKDVGIKSDIRNVFNENILGAQDPNTGEFIYKEMQDVRDLYKAKRRAVDTVEKVLGKSNIRYPEAIEGDAAGKKIKSLYQMSRESFPTPKGESRAEIIKRILSPDVVRELGGYSNAMKIINMSKTVAKTGLGLTGLGALGVGAKSLLK